MLLKLIAIALTLVVEIISVDFNVNRCNSKVAMANFDMGKFLGTWHVVAESAFSFSCTTHVIKKAKSSAYFDEETSVPTDPFDVSHMDRATKDVRILKFAHGNNSAWLTRNATWRLDPKNMIVFATNYEDYAGVYLCNTEKLKYMGYISMVDIYSRKRTLKRKFLDEIKEKMKSLGITPQKLYNVDHRDCARDLKFNFTFTMDKFKSSARKS